MVTTELLGAGPLSGYSGRHRDKDRARVSDPGRYFQ
jgi:hypothetical protein